MEDELPPESGEFMRNISDVYLGLTATCGVLTLIIFGIYAEQLYFLYSHFGTWRLRFHIAFVLSIYSAYSMFSMVTLFVPRAIPINNMISGFYISTALYVFVRLLVGHYGSMGIMLCHLVGQNMSLRSPPLCCCCFCLPTITLTRNIVLALECSVLQYGIIRPIASYVQAIVFAERQYKFDVSSVFSRGVFLVTSTLVAMYGLQLLYRVSIDPLSHIPLKAKFRCLQIVLLIDNLQSALFTTLGANDVIHSADGLSAQINGYRIHRICTVFEMLLLATVARIVYRRYMKKLVLHDGVAAFPRTASTLSTSTIVTNDEMATTANGDLRGEAMGGATWEATGTASVDLPGVHFSGIAINWPAQFGEDSQNGGKRERQELPQQTTYELYY